MNTLRLLFRVLLGGSALALITGCVTPETTPVAAASPQKQAESLTLQEGDSLKISFPGAPNLDTAQTIRRDGKITLAMVGEVTASGRTPIELEQELLKLYGPQLISKEVTVVVASSSYPIFVSGAVIRPGKISVDRPLTALEAIMEAGGFDNAKADLSAVKIVRQENGGTKNYTVNLKQVLDGKSSEAFYLKRSDIIYVPEKFSWF